MHQTNNLYVLFMMKKSRILSPSGYTGAHIRGKLSAFVVSYSPRLVGSTRSIVHWFSLVPIHPFQLLFGYLW